MPSNSSRRRFIGGAAAAAATLMGKVGHTFGRADDASAAHRPAALRTDADTSPAGVTTAVYTYDSHGRLLAVTHPCDALATTFAYPDA